MFRPSVAVAMAVDGHFAILFYHNVLYSTGQACDELKPNFSDRPAEFLTTLPISSRDPDSIMFGTWRYDSLNNDIIVTDQDRALSSHNDAVFAPIHTACNKCRAEKVRWFNVESLL